MATGGSPHERPDETETEDLEYGRVRLTTGSEFQLGQLVSGDGVHFGIHDEAGECLSAEDKIVRKKRPRLNFDEEFKGINLRQPLNFIPDDQMEANYNEPLLGDYQELGKLFQDVTSDGSIKKRIVRVGNGERPPLHATVFIEYEAWTEEGDEPFYKTENWVKFRFFQANVLGWMDYVVSEMDLHELSHYLVAPKYMFGEHGLLGLVPPDSTCLFKVALKKFIVSSSVPNLLALTSEQRKNIGFDEYEKAVNELKEFAKRHIQDEEYGWALKRYEKGVRILESFLTIEDDFNDKRDEILFVLYNNMAFCHLQYKDYKKTIYMCKKALEFPEHIRGDRAKVYYRLASAEFELGHYEKAHDFVKTAMNLQTANPQIVQLFFNIQDQLEVDKKKSKKLCEKMFSNLSLNSKKD